MIGTAALIICLAQNATIEQDLLLLSQGILSKSMQLMSKKQDVVKEASRSNDPYWKAIRNDLPKYYDMASFELALAYAKANDAPNARTQVQQLGDLRLRALAHLEIADSLAKHGKLKESQVSIKAALDYVPSIPVDDRHEIFMLAASRFYDLKDYNSALKTSRMVWPNLKNYEKLPVKGGPSRVPYEKWSARRIEALSLAGIGNWGEAERIGETHPKIDFRAKTLLDLAFKNKSSTNTNNWVRYLKKGSSYASQVSEAKDSIQLLLQVSELLHLSGETIRSDEKLDAAIQKLSSIPDDIYSGDRHLNRMKLLIPIYESSWRLGATSQIGACESLVSKWYTNNNTKFAQIWSIELLSIKLHYSRYSSRSISADTVAKGIELSRITDSIDLPWEALSRIVIELKKQGSDDQSLSLLDSLKKFASQGFGGGLDSAEISMAAGCASKIAEATFGYPAPLSLLRIQAETGSAIGQKSTSSYSQWPNGKVTKLISAEGKIEYYLDVPKSFKHSSPVVCVYIPPGTGGQAFSPIDSSNKGIAMAWIKSGPYQVGELAGRAVQIIDDIKRRYGGNTRFILSGLSAGGFAALQASVSRSDTIIGLIMVGSSQVIPQDLSFPVVFLVGKSDYNLDKAKVNQKASAANRVSIVIHSGGHTIGDQKSRSKAIEELLKLTR